MENASAVMIEGATIIESFRATVRKLPDRPAMRRRTRVGWETLTWADYGQAVAEVTAGLVDLGIGPGERVAILSHNRVEWHLADMGALANGGVTVPIYPTSSAEQVGYILDHCGARLCFVEDDDLLAKVLEVRPALPKLDRVVVFDDSERGDDPYLEGFSQLRGMGIDRLQREPGLADERASGVAPEQAATFVYTSGTTGPPKAAVLTHANIMWTIRSAASLVHLESGERFLSFLPLSHVAERGMSEFAPITIGGETSFTRSLATVAEDLLDCRPTVFFAVPRVWEKLQMAVLEKIEDAPWLARHMVRRFLELGQHLQVERQAGRRAAPWETLPHAVLDAGLGRGSDGRSASTGPTSSSPPPLLSTPTSCTGCTPSVSPSSSSTARPRCAGPRPATHPRTTAWAPWVAPCPECGCASPGTARSSSREETSARGTSTTRTAHPSSSTARVGCTPGTWERSTPTDTSDSPVGRRTSSSRPRARTSPRWTSRWS